MVYTVFYKTSSFAGYCFLDKNSIHPKRRDVFNFEHFKVTLVKFQICSFIVCILFFIDHSFQEIFFIFPVSYLFSYYILSFLSVVVLLQIPRYNDSRIHMIFRKGESWHEKRKRSHPSVFKKNIRIKSIRQRI